MLYSSDTGCYKLVNKGQGSIDDESEDPHSGNNEM